MNMETTADKRSMESPDSTLKPEGKSLKTSGVASATAVTSTSTCAVDAEVPDTGNPQVPTIRGNLRQFQKQGALCGECTGILFDSSDLLREAVKCLEEILNDKTQDAVGASGSIAASPGHTDSQEKKNDAEPPDSEKGNDPMSVSTDDEDPKMPLHQAMIQLLKIRMNLRRNPLRIGLLVSQRQAMESCGLRVCPPLGALRSLLG